MAYVFSYSVARERWRKYQLMKHMEAIPEWTRERAAELGVRTRERGDIPNCRGETSPIDTQRLIEKYSIGPNDPPWVFEALSKREETQRLLTVKPTSS